ncbi:hypothetical protein AB0I24_15470 [Brachybacterium paraconglomeratum]
MGTQITRKKDTGEQGNGGQFGSVTRQDAEVSVPDGVRDEVRLHPADRPETNPALKDIPQDARLRSMGVVKWTLDRQEAERYAASIGTSGAHRLAQLDAEYFVVGKYGRFDAYVSSPDGDYLLEAHRDSVDLLLSAEVNDHAEKAEDAGVVIDVASIDARSGEVTSVEWGREDPPVPSRSDRGRTYEASEKGQGPFGDLRIGSWSQRGVQQLAGDLTDDAILQRIQASRG